MKIHIVQKGDTLWNISKKYGVNFEELKKMNAQLSNPDMIMPGMKIKVPTSGGMVKKEMAVKKEMPKAQHPFAQQKPAAMPVQTPKEAIKPAPKKEMPVKEMPKKPYTPKMPKPVIPEIDINNYYMMNMANMQMQTQQMPQAPKAPQVMPKAPKAPQVMPQAQKAPQKMPKVPKAPTLPKPKDMPEAVAGVQEEESPESPQMQMPYAPQMQPEYCYPVSPVMPGSGLGPMHGGQPMHGGYPMNQPMQGGYPMGPMGQVQGAQTMPQGLPGMQQPMMPYMGYEEESSSFMPYMPQQMAAPMGGQMMGPMGSPSAVAGVQDEDDFYPTAQMPMGGMPQQQMPMGGMQPQMPYSPYPGMMGPDNCYPASPVMPGTGFENPGMGGPEAGYGNPGMTSPAGYGNPYGQMPQVQGAMMEESPGMYGAPVQQGGCGCGGPALTGQYGPGMMPGGMHHGMHHGMPMGQYGPGPGMSPYGPGMMQGGMQPGPGYPGMYGPGPFGMPRFDDDFED